MEPWMLPIMRFAHVLCVVFPLVGMVRAHWITRKLDQPLTVYSSRTLLSIHSGVWVCLIGLWITGLVSLFVGAFNAPETRAYLFNPKLLVKMGVVMILTMTGLLIHHFVVPRMKEGFVFVSQSLRFQITAVLIGSLSIASWTTAFTFGLAREWNQVAPLANLLALYAGIFLLVALTGFFDVFLTMHSKLASSQRGPELVMDRQWKEIDRGHSVRSRVFWKLGSSPGAFLRLGSRTVSPRQDEIPPPKLQSVPKRSAG